jgi:hypothetical protein
MAVFRLGAYKIQAKVSNRCHIIMMNFSMCDSYIWLSFIMEVHEIKAPGFECHFSQSITVTTSITLCIFWVSLNVQIQLLLKCWTRMLLMDDLVLDLYIVTSSSCYTKFSCGSLKMLRISGVMLTLYVFLWRYWYFVFQVHFDSINHLKISVHIPPIYVSMSYYLVPGNKD